MAVRDGDLVTDAPAVEADQELVEDQEMVELVPDQGEEESHGVSFSASITAKDWTVETLVSQMRKGRIDLSPSFQRRNAWLDNRKAKLIESMILGFPIPQIVLAEQKDKPGHYFVLDGKQRLLALRQFFADNSNPLDEGFDSLTLSALEVLSDLNRLDANSMEEFDSGAFATLENYTIRTVVLGSWNSEELLLSLFLRLNTGSVALSPQELRQALVPGQFMSWLDKTSGEMPALMSLLGNVRADRRMVDAELLLRHLAFSISPIRYRGNLKAFLDDTSRTLNKEWAAYEGDVLAEAAELSAALDFTRQHIGPGKRCRKWSGVRYERALNRAVFDIQVYSFSFPDVRDAAEPKVNEVMEAFQSACDSNTAFIRSVTTTTKTADAFRTRHKVWQKIIQDGTGIKYPLPESLRAQ